MMLGRIEFKQAGCSRTKLPIGIKDVLRTQHSSDCAVLQNKTAENSPKLAPSKDRLFLAGLLGFAIILKKVFATGPIVAIVSLAHLRTMF